MNEIIISIMSTLTNFFLHFLQAEDSRERASVFTLDALFIYLNENEHLLFQWGISWCEWFRKQQTKHAGAADDDFRSRDIMHVSGEREDVEIWKYPLVHSSTPFSFLRNESRTLVMVTVIGSLVDSRRDL